MTTRLNESLAHNSAAQKIYLAVPIVNEQLTVRSAITMQKSECFLLELQ